MYISYIYIYLIIYVYIYKKNLQEWTSLGSGKGWGSMGSASWKGVGVEVRWMYKVSVTQDGNAWWPPLS